MALNVSSNVIYAQRNVNLFVTKQYTNAIYNILARKKPLPNIPRLRSALPYLNWDQHGRNDVKRLKIYSNLLLQRSRKQIVGFAKRRLKRVRRNLPIGTHLTAATLLSKTQEELLRPRSILTSSRGGKVLTITIDFMQQHTICPSYIVIFLKIFIITEVEIWDDILLIDTDFEYALESDLILSLQSLFALNLSPVHINLIFFGVKKEYFCRNQRTVLLVFRH